MDHIGACLAPHFDDAYTAEEIVLAIQPNTGRDHAVRLATTKEREPYFAHEPQVDPKCHYCSEGVEYIGSYVRRAAAVSAKSGKRTDYERRVEIRLCPRHTAEWTQAHHLRLMPRLAPVEPTLPRQQCPYCGAIQGETLELIQRLGTGIHTLRLICCECSRPFEMRVAIGVNLEYSTIPERSLRP
jgi:hypothetical protein